MTFLEQLFNAKLRLTTIASIAAGLLLGQFLFYALIDQVMRIKKFIQHWSQEQVKNVSAFKQVLK